VIVKERKRTKRGKKKQKQKQEERRIIKKDIALVNKKIPNRKQVLLSRSNHFT